MVDDKIVITPFPELHSEEVHEIISHPPHWLLRWGITLIFGMLIAFASASWLIKYPDIVPIRITLTAVNPPRAVIVRNEGKLSKLLTKDGEEVKVGQLLGYTETTADPLQIIHLSQDIKPLRAALMQSKWDLVSNWDGSNYTHLGEIQNDYQTFNQKLSELKTFLDNGYYAQKRELLLRDLTDLKSLEENLREQLALQKKDYILAEDEFNTHEKLFQNNVIPRLEFKRETAKLLSKEIPLKNLAFSLIQNRSSQTAKLKEIIELNNSVEQQKIGFIQVLQTFESAVETWKQRYLLTASVPGKLSFTAPWSEQQHMAIGEEFALIEPQTESIEGIVKIPQANLGKIQEGQQVLIKLDGYPFREYGIVEGYLSKFSLTPGRDSLYWGHVTMPNQLRTRYNKTLDYRNGMKGTAEVITQDRRLAERLVSSVRNGGN